MASVTDAKAAKGRAQLEPSSMRRVVLMDSFAMISPRMVDVGYGGFSAADIETYYGEESVPGCYSYNRYCYRTVTASESVPRSLMI